MRRFFSAELDETSKVFAFDSEQSAHITRVLRLKPDETVRVFDGRGNEFIANLLKVDSKQVTAKLKNRVEPASPESALNFVLAVALLKGEKFDMVIQKAVELGVSRFVPLVSKRSDVKPKNADKKLVRWKRIIIEASKQCGRAKLMYVEPPQEFFAFIPKASGLKLFFAETGGDDFLANDTCNSVTALIGPEGGWSAEEIETAKNVGFLAITFGGRILRAETAAIAFSAIIQNRFGDIT
ncbi:MAG: 16S rRNA (uracil(1498)-N(3))-methyltransferase [Pyrinomonadaceae bacterium]